MAFVEIVWEYKKGVYKSIDNLDKEDFVLPYLAIPFTHLYFLYQDSPFIYLHYEIDNLKTGRFRGELSGSKITFGNFLTFEVPLKFSSMPFKYFYHYQTLFFEKIFNREYFRNIALSRNDKKVSLSPFKFFIVKPVLYFFELYQLALNNFFIKKSKFIYPSQSVYKIKNSEYINTSTSSVSCVILKYDDNNVNQINKLYMERGITLINFSSRNEVPNLVRVTV